MKLGSYQVSPLLASLVTLLSFGSILGCQAASPKQATGSTSAVVITPAAVSFGDHALNTTTSKMVAVVNTGTTAAVVQNVSLRGSSEFKLQNWAGTTDLAPGGQLQLTVNFTPTSAGSSSASLTIQADASSNAAQAVTLSGTGQAPGSSNVSLTISPDHATLQANLSQQFIATVKGTSDTAVTWLVNGIAGGNSTLGTISAAGLYTAPGLVPVLPVSVSARSTANPAVSGSAAVTIEPAPSPASVTVSPTSANLQVGLSQQFIATVKGSSDTGIPSSSAVTWLVNGVAGGNSTLGTVSSGGLYTAPQNVPSGGAVSVIARSAADPTKSAQATVKILPAVSKVTVKVSPANTNVAGGGTQQFSATVTGASDTAVNWSVNSIRGGNASVGTISSSGLYSAPACPSASSVTITATSAYDSSASANAAATISAGGGNGDYYVANTGSDSNSGSACSPWATLSHADGVVSPGDTVHVAPGTYQFNVTTSTSGTATAPIRYISDTQWGAKIIGNADSVWLNTGSYVTIEGFDITASNPDTRQGILSYGPHCKILGNRIHDIQAVAGLSGNGGAGISPNNNGSQAADYTTVSGNIVYNIAQGASTDYVQGIYVNGSQYNVISNNLIFQCGGWGIQQWHTGVGHMTAINNTIFGCSGGILLGSGDTSNPSDYNFIANNILYKNNGEDGIYECCSSSNSGVGTHQTYTNNLLYQNTPGDTSLQWSGNKATNMVTANPLFVNGTGDQNGDYQLQSGSPAINAGTSTNAPNLDIEGGSRPVGGAWDIGAYEYGAAAGKWPWF